MLHPHKRSFHIPNGNGQDAFQHIFPHLAVDQPEQEPPSGPPRDNEISLHMPHAPTVVDFEGSFGDHAFSFELLFCSPSAVLLLQYPLPVIFDAPAIRAFDVSPDG